MLRSMGTKGGSVLYNIRYGGYDISLGCPSINGVINCCHHGCWLISVGWVTKPGCDQICGIVTPTCIIGVLVVIGGREVLNFSLINCFILTSTKGKWLNSCPTCWQYA
jgi:hypothetical protein